MSLMNYILGNTKFLGKRYAKDNDFAVVLVYDVRGYIAGIQAGVCMLYLSFMSGGKWSKSIIPTRITILIKRTCCLL